MEKLELGDIQGLLARGYGRLRAARFLLLGIAELGPARAWLADLVQAVARADEDPHEAAVHLAFTASGLRRFGLPEGAMGGFSHEFREGMTTGHRRRVLGDIGPDDPELWWWGGPRNAGVDVALLLYATTDEALEAVVATHLATLASAGMQVVATLETKDTGANEHFGFRDGVSQPIVEGMGREGPAADVIKPGEFVLGYRNEYGLLTDRPLLGSEHDRGGVLPADAGGSKAKDFGRNGSYLVIRQLEQDVPLFWRSLDEMAAGDPDTRVKLASKMVGRWPGGAPLAISPERDDPALATANDFGYHGPDADGLGCPVGAHVRRTNPRDSLDPDPGSEDSIKLNKRHRILRRGRAYGPRISVEDALRSEGQQEQRGLHFACLVGNIARQFEFVQHTWANNPKFDGLYEEVDPIMGPRGPEGATFAMPSLPVRRRLTGLPQFATVRGGGYFFLPGIRALRYLASSSSSGSG